MVLASGAGAAGAAAAANDDDDDDDDEAPSQSPMLVQHPGYSTSYTACTVAACSDRLPPCHIWK